MKNLREDRWFLPLHKLGPLDLGTTKKASYVLQHRFYPKVRAPWKSSQWIGISSQIRQNTVRLMDINIVPHPLHGTPYGHALDLAIILSLACWSLSVITRDYSWVDRIWSICPAIYCLIVAAASDFSSTRLNIMTLLVFAWGVRLTFNLARKGGYRVGSEDYRWKMMRERLGPGLFQALNVTFIAPGQMLVIWLFTSPVHHAWLGHDQSLNFIDFLAILSFLFLLLMEAISDNQMWTFQQHKKSRMEAGESGIQPFITDGLFSYCRHPSFFCEMGMWYVFYLFGVASTGDWIHWSGLGLVSLTMIFFGSTRLTESISIARYPSYRQYQAATPRLIPFTRIGCIGLSNATPLSDGTSNDP